MNPILYAKGKQAKQLELKKKLNENPTSIDAMIAAMREEELFQPHKRKWADDATKTAV